MSCGSALRWFDNVPLLSYALLRGRCRSCKAPIGWVYPAVEAATAALLAGCVLAFGFSGRALVAGFFCAVLVAISATDLEHRIVPNRIVLPATVLVLAGQTIVRPSPEWALGALGASLFLFLAAIAYPAGMGMGDVKFALLLGAMLGRYAGVALMVGMVAALVPGVVLLARHGRAARKMGVPFAPFLALGGVVALFAGHAVMHGYLTLFA
jgi:leader peptidase (prepilin peptidase)/N-methyltransferase